MGDLMATQHLHRLFICVPSSLRDGANTWIRNNLNPSGGDWLTVPISATGNLPATYWGCDAALTSAQLKALVIRLLQFSGVSLPAAWDSWTLAQKRTWLRDTLPVKLWTQAPAGSKIGVLYVSNDGDWSDHTVDNALEQVNLQRVAASLPGGG